MRVRGARPTAMVGRWFSGAAAGDWSQPLHAPTATPEEWAGRPDVRASCSVILETALRNRTEARPVLATGGRPNRVEWLRALPHRGLALDQRQGVLQPSDHLRVDRV